MEMDDDPPGFKVQWLNGTLNFIKNDQELVYKYPEWPISRVKFYHALISQRQCTVGLGFKSLYAPLWEAMQLFRLKYTYKVTIINSKDEEKGFLVLEKIPKKSEVEDETDSEDDTSCRHQLTKESEKRYIRNRGIIEKISPTFLKTTLQSLLGFINDEASASIDFKDLAPIEAKFIENVQAIHDQKYLFYKIFSPACIDLLKKMTSSLTLFKNTYNLKVSNVKTDPKTAKREVTVIKEPNFNNSPVKKRSKSKVKPLRSPKCNNAVTAPNKSETESSCKKNGELSPMEVKIITDKESKSATKNDSGNKKESVSTSPTSGEQKRTESSCKKNGELSPMEVKIITDKESKSAAKNDSGNKKESVSTSPTSGEEKRITRVPENVTKKIRESPVRSAKGKGLISKGYKNKGIIEGMLKPLESDIAIRMMKLMGWEGGALGLRGEGITEPIMPSLHLKPGAGLGHNKNGRNVQSAAGTVKSNSDLQLIRENKGKENKNKETNTSHVNSVKVIETPTLENVRAKLMLKGKGVLGDSELREQVLRVVLDFVKRDDMKMEMDLSSGYSKIVYNYMKRLCRSIKDRTLMNIHEPELHIVEEICMNLNNKTYLMVNLRNKILIVCKTLDSHGATPSKEQNTSKKVKSRLKNNDKGVVSDTNCGKEDCEMKNNVSAKYTDTSKVLSNGVSVEVIIKKDAPVSKDETMENLFYDCKRHITPKNDEKLVNDNIRKNDSSSLNNIDIKSEKKGKKSSKSKAGQELSKKNIKANNEVSAIVSTSSKNKCVDVLKVNLRNEDCNDNVIRTNGKSEIHEKTECFDTRSHKNNKHISKNGQLDNIYVIEYKEYNIIKIVLQDLDTIGKISSSIQGLIVNNENFSKNNYLKCHGIQNGGLIYSSDGDWFKDILYKNFKINCSIGTIVNFKMKVYLNSFLKLKDVLNALEVHNEGLITNNWIILEEGNCYFVVDLNRDSFEFIRKQRFSLFAGIDTAIFTVIL